jgi:Lar family restriction alleviation protein
MKPCPFCAGQGMLAKSLRDGCQDGEPDAWAHFVRCRSCGAQGPWFKSAGNAERYWNQRAASKREG